MFDLHSFEAIEKKLQSSQNLVAIFGKLPKGTTEIKKKALRKSFGNLAKLVHEDHVPNSYKVRAKEIFLNLNAIRGNAVKAIEDNTYEEPVATEAPHKSHTSAPNFFDIQSKKGTYRFSQNIFATGDFSVLYRGEMLFEGGAPILAKIASKPEFNPWLEKESEILAQFRDAPKKSMLSGIKKYVPHLVDTFMVSGEQGTSYRCTVLPFTPDLVTAVDIRKAFPDGLAPKDAAWVFRRILAHTLAASMVGVVHGAIVPDHVLMGPVSHFPFFIGWTHAVDISKKNQRITHVIDRWRDFYPPEVFVKEAPTHKTDLYMAGMCMLYILGVDLKRKNMPKSIPDTVQRLILSCVEEMPSRRPENGKIILDEFSRAVWDVWGKVYRPLEMPVQ